MNGNPRGGLVGMVKATVANTIKKGTEQRWGRQLATILEQQAILLRLAYGGQSLLGQCSFPLKGEDAPNKDEGMDAPTDMDAPTPAPDKKASPLTGKDEIVQALADYILAEDLLGIVKVEKMVGWSFWDALPPIAGKERASLCARAIARAEEIEAAAP